MSSYIFMNLCFFFTFKRHRKLGQKKKKETWEGHRFTRWSFCV